MSEQWDRTGARFVTGDPIPEALTTAAGVNRLLEQRDELRAALTRLAAWCRRPEFTAQASLAHVHGMRPSAAMIVEGVAVWAEVDALLVEP